MKMQITWDPCKEEGNLRKHGIGFDEAATVFLTAGLVKSDQDHGELRLIRLGFSARLNILVVIYVYTLKDEIRIISARKATKAERREYERRV